MSDTKLIRLSGKWATGAYTHAIVDACMYDELAQFKWKAKWNGSRNHVYAVRTQKLDGKTVDVRMHRVVLQYEGPLDVDHINKNSLDNRRANLRAVTRSVNIKNTECFQGRTWCAWPRKLPQSSEQKLFACLHCANDYAPARSDQLYCSDGCRYDARAYRPLTASCAHCQSSYMKTRSDRVYCSTRCRREANRPRKPAPGLGPYPEVPPRVRNDREIGLLHGFATGVVP